MAGVSPFFSTPGFGGGLSALAQAFMPDPDGEARRLAATANARLSGTRADQIRAGMEQNPIAGDAIARGDLQGAYAAWARGGNPDIMARAPAFARGAGAAAGVDPNRLAQLFVGAGGNYAHTQPGFEATDATNRRGDDLRLQGTLGAAGIAAGASRYGADRRYAADVYGVDQTQAGLDRRMAPEINPGNVVVVPPNSPLATRADERGRIDGNMRPQTRDQAIAEQVPLYLRPPEGEDPAIQTRRREVVAPSVSNAETRGGRAVLDVSGADARAIDEQIGAMLPSGSGLDNTAAARVRVRAAELYQQTRNLPLAVQQALEEFMASSPPRVDNRWNPMSDTRYGAPPAQGAAPAGRAAPAAPVETPAGVPARPSTVPPGSAYSPSRRQWRGPDGRLFNADGSPIA